MPDQYGTLRAVQVRLFKNKSRQGFNTTDTSLEFNLLTAEVGEAIDAWRKTENVQAALGDELADVILYAMGVASINGIDIEDAVLTKMAVNESRRYRTLPNGTHVKEGHNV
jgi:NTP pyrophosphatase (non-canonical NTP hydrolase)